MEESKELQKLYGFMQAFIYITVCIEILLFVHFPFSEQIMPLLSKMAKIPIYSNILYSKLFTFFIIMVTCIGTWKENQCTENTFSFNLWIHNVLWKYMLSFL